MIFLSWVGWFEAIVMDDWKSKLGTPWVRSPDIETYPLVNVNKKLLKIAIEIVSFPIKNGDFQ